MDIYTITDGDIVCNDMVYECEKTVNSLFEKSKIENVFETCRRDRPLLFDAFKKNEELIYKLAGENKRIELLFAIHKHCEIAVEMTGNKSKSKSMFESDLVASEESRRQNILNRITESRLNRNPVREREMIACSEFLETCSA